MTEVAFSPDGLPVGTLTSQRRLDASDSGVVQVTQRINPQLASKTHALNGLGGVWNFAVRAEGSTRQYLGPDVLGNAIALPDGTLITRGIWPRVAHTFESLVLRVNPDRQISHQRISHAGDLVAHLVGVAITDPSRGEAAADAVRFPNLSQPYRASEMSAHWQGSLETFTTDGKSVTQARHWREQSATTLTEPGLELAFTSLPGRAQVSGTVAAMPMHGIAKRSGWMFELEAHASNGSMLHSIELLDPDSRMLFGVRRWHHQQVLSRIEVLRLQPVVTPQR